MKITTIFEVSLDKLVNGEESEYIQQDLEKHLSEDAAKYQTEKAKELETKAEVLEQMKRSP